MNLHFFSACETAVGDHDTPDEVIHLAAGLQFAGVKSVIGTLWKVNDSTVQRLVEAFYKNLCGSGKMNSKQAARALAQSGPVVGQRQGHALRPARSVHSTLAYEQFLSSHGYTQPVAKDSIFDISDFETVYLHDMYT
ncbi:CHAT domain-containing protein [Suillus subalutaceus]|uniref:CHAT domain-containing protein n=1 Tax=Suillus subalutaceus TaxID=48586 RepID=UPI001B87A6FF|nr:CHAT domain-containing protein [Suillus subalutaceus]KAG1846177.1 CHAT domain-containing protein [Suillus subalutaceus]